MYSYRTICSLLAYMLDIFFWCSALAATSSALCMINVPRNPANEARYTEASRK
jgi:hypothetical protein